MTQSPTITLNAYSLNMGGQLDRSKDTQQSQSQLTAQHPTITATSPCLIVSPCLLVSLCCFSIALCLSWGWPHSGFFRSLHLGSLPPLVTPSLPTDWVHFDLNTLTGGRYLSSLMHSTGVSPRYAAGVGLHTTAQHWRDELVWGV